MNFGRSGRWRRSSAGPGARATSVSIYPGPKSLKNCWRETQSFFAVAAAPLGYRAADGAHVAASGATSAGHSLDERIEMGVETSGGRNDSPIRRRTSALARNQPGGRVVLPTGERPALSRRNLAHQPATF